MNDKVRFLKKTFGGSNLGPVSLNQAQNDVFCHFLEAGSQVFLENAYDHSLHMTMSNMKNLEGPNLD